MRTLIVTAALLLAGPASAQDREVDWVRKPRPEDIAALIPAKAMQAGVSGKVTLVCDVATTGLLSECKAAKETPAGMGFGAAAPTLASGFQMKPAMRGGVAVTSTASIPIVFQVDKGGVAPSAMPTTYRLVTNVPWAAYPTSPMMAAAFPAKGTGKSQSGHVVLRCRFTESLTLKACAVASEAPLGMGFGKAAKSVVGQFRAAPELAPSLGKDVQVDLPIHFIDPASAAWTGRQIPKPVWTRTPSPEAAEAFFPKQAAEKGLKTGRSVVRCVVQVGGKLGQCTIVSEEPAGLGFGAAGLQMAPLLEMMPWTSEGLPADGVAVIMPIRVSQGE